MNAEEAGYFEIKHAMESKINELEQKIKKVAEQKPETYTIKKDDMTQVLAYLQSIDGTLLTLLDEVQNHLRNNFV